ncbi:MAG: DegT/DnrJ/EryC1/StrS family aminotransferase [Candidatus Aegiribacteria sp.]|nr:DegT/DnrJ/EryC1/StrS family aminotransferase [Candidatus Aegiribacteria sp.]
MAVPLLDISRQHIPIVKDLRKVFDKALETSAFIKGSELVSLEEEFSEYCETEIAVGCASGTDALILALMAAGVKPGEYVITTPFTFFATAGAVVRAGGIPVFVDILPDTFNMDPDLLSDWLRSNCAVTNRGIVDKSNGTRIAAVMPVHLFGQMAEMDRIMIICDDWRIPVVEDAAQAVGAKWDGKKAGSFGSAGCFSFFPSKNLGALGDGGMVTTSDHETAERIVRLREHGGQGYIHREVGFNSRLDALQAGFLRVKLSHLEEWHKGRRKNANFYRSAFKGVKQIKTPVIRKKAWSIYNQYTLRAENRDELLAWLRERKIGCAVYYPLPLHLQECFECLGYKEGDFPVSENASKEVISLPVFGELTETELNEVVDSIKEFYAEKA